MQKLNLVEVWTRELYQYEQNFDWDIWGNQSAFQNGLIYHFIMSSYLTMVENVNEGGMDSRKFLLLTTQHQFSGESHLQEI